jgi:hypothetical protein
MGPLQSPPEQVSGLVHWFPSLHEPEIGLVVQPVWELQPSIVHSLPSLQVRCVPPQLEPEHVSLIVH